MSTSQDNCSGVDVIGSTPSTNETSVRVVTKPQWGLTRQDTEVLIQPPAGPQVRPITMESVSKQTLCSTGANVKVNTIATEAVSTTDQQSHRGDYEPWTYPIAFYFKHLQYNSMLSMWRCVMWLDSQGNVLLT